MDDFIKGVLMNEEILNSRIYWESPSPTEYALPITSWKVYYKLSRDIFQRQAFPLSLDLHPFFKDYNCLSVLKSTYKHKTALFSKGSSLQNDSIIGQNTFLGRNVSLTRTIIGDSCKVGNEVIVENCYLFSGVTIGDNASLKNCLILPNSILDDSVILDGCILAAGIKLSKSMYSGKILQKKDGRIVAEDIFDPDYLESGEVFLFFNERETPKEEDDSKVMDSLSRGYQEKLNCENLILEINSSRYAYNMGIREVTYNVLKAILGLPVYYFKSNDSPMTDEIYMKTLKGMLAYFKKIIINYMKTEEAQDDCLRAIEDVASTTKAIFPFIRYLVHYLYDIDVLSEEKIMDW
ncbi:translation initiation factor eIF-2B subunit epsilon-like [Belonocnema kinseyi]|uniref:translation initiation factor eIF-2B subunit epsilon-like n=1 Tax=Belonocnema kinseyi TaxID=2817044 RepID=UPI00143D1407|nr:translation initiation factor eIF-2B subunit epsilon-like [Belonocnema kinseyi]